MSWPILTIIIILSSVKCNWEEHEDVRTGRTSLISSGTFSSASIPISYNVTYSTVISGAKSAGVGVLGFNSGISTSFSINVTITNFAVDSMMLTLTVMGDTSLTLLSVNWIAFGPKVDFAEILLNCFLCTTLSTGKGDRSETRTGVATLGGKNSLTSKVFLSGFIMQNGEGLNNYLNSSSSIATGSKTINYEFSTSENNTITSICYVTIIFCEQCTQVEYYHYGKLGTSIFKESLMSATYTNDDFSLSASDPDYKKENRMFFAISSFNVSRAMPRIFGFDSTDYAQLNPMVQNEYSYNYGSHVIGTSYFYIATRDCNATHSWFVTDPADLGCENNCPASASIESDDTNNKYCTVGCYYTCPNECDHSEFNQCKKCETLNFRTPFPTTTSPFQCVCQTGYVDIGVVNCYPCSTFIPGCNSCSNTLICTGCKIGFTRTATGICQCTVGHLVSGVCTNITGCIELTMYIGVTQCLTCNTSLYFQPDGNYGCECSSGYYLSATEVCESLCGDGKKTLNEGCDDGNLVLGDGCNNVCVVETGWICFNGTTTTKSNCYINSSFSLVVKYIRRITDSNKMQLALSISPVLDQLSDISFENNLNHNIPALSYTSSYNNGIILLEFLYNQTLESNLYYVNLTLDSAIFYQASLQTTFLAEGMNAKLTYDSYNNMNKPLEITVIVLSVLAVVIAFASTLSEKMIGIEMIQTIQAVLFTQSVMKSTPSSYSPLQMLRYSSGYNEVQGTDSSRTFTFSNSLSSLGLEKEFLLSYNLMYGIMLGIGGICLIFKIVQCYHSLSNKNLQITEIDKSEIKYLKSTNIFNFIFERVFFVSVFLCMFLIVFALMLQLTSMSPEYTLLSSEFNLISTAIAFSILITMTCGVILNGFYPNILLFPTLMKQAYPPVYFIYQFAFAFVLAFNYTQYYTLYVLEAMSFIYLLMIIIYRPYPEKFHNFVLILHQLFIMAVMGVYIFENISTPIENEKLYKILNLVIVLVMFLIVFLNIYRIYAYYQFLKSRGWDQYGNSKDLIYEDLDATFDYKQFEKTSPLRIREPLNGTKSKEKSKIKNSDDLELDDMKKFKDKKKKSQPTDESQINWIHNNDETLDPNSSRFEPTNRTAKPDTSKEADKSLMKGKTNDKNFNKHDREAEEDNTGKDLDKYKGKRKNSFKNENDETKYPEGNEEGIENPYDENGYSKPSNKNIKENNDPLDATRKRLRFDFTSKVKK